MSATYRPVGWNPAKRAYDAVLVGAVVGYLVLYTRLGPRLQDPALELDTQTMALRALGSCAFLLLTLALAIGPLARLDRRFLPLLYNRRHLGVLTFLVALAHALEVLGWYFAFSPTPPLVAMLSSEPLRGAALAHAIPFIPFGVVALVILFALAATSHDFWLNFLSPPVWKWLHMAIYPAYALVVAHVAFGALQSTRNAGLAVIVVGSAVLLAALHLAAAWRQARADRRIAAAAANVPWVVAAEVDSIAEGRGIVVHLSGAEPVAIFRHQNQLSAVSNLCAHQNGPLGEGRVIDGCITCPWHGFQYRLADGCAPPPFTEKLATYRLALDGTAVLLDPRPNPPGTFVAPLPLAAAGTA